MTRTVSCDLTEEQMIQYKCQAQIAYVVSCQRTLCQGVERERERERERAILMCIISLNKKVHYKKRQNKTSCFIVDEHWSQWSTWGNCEPSGGKEGVSNRTRACGRLSVSNGNKKCPGSSVESKTCVLCRGMRIKFHAKFFLSIKLSFSMYLYLYMFTVYIKNN